MTMKLGLLYKNGRVVNHRSLIKVILNPILRYFGINIVTRFDKNVPLSVRIYRCERLNHIKWDFNSHNEYDKLVKKRRFI